ncbi:MAG: hypothetical protein RLZ57_435 [Actinomycetota bacterium]|jgi:XTP/dITP diphosphohydrolase
MQVILATKNKGKVVELQRILAEFPGAEKLEIISLEKFPELQDIEETGTTFIENALLKAHSIADATGIAAIADDSGICVDFLNGAPGIFSARYSGNGDAENNQKLLKVLENVPDEKRGAYFYCAAVFVTPASSGPKIELIAEGRFEGKISYEIRGSGGFGYDPLFIPSEQPNSVNGEGISTRTSAELSAHEKDSISHRGKALRSLVPKILASDLLR